MNDNIHMKPFIKIQILAVIVLFTLLAPINFSSASGFIKDKDKIDKNAQEVGAAAGYDSNTNASSALVLVQTVINIFLSIIGVLLLAYILYAGYNWMTAQGEEEKVSKAKDTIKRAIIGVIIIVAAYAISVFVMSRIEVGTLKGASGVTDTPSQ